MVRDIIPFIFWPWFGLSCFILLRRRVSHGSWRAMGPQESSPPIEFPPPPPETMSEPSAAGSPPERPGHEVDQADGAAVAVMAPIDLSRPRARSLADAVEGIVMPCDLAPLMGVGPLKPREVAFFTSGYSPATVGAALSDELERLGYEITPLDDRSIRAARGPDEIEARLLSHEITAAEVMRELHPSAPAGALVAEMKLI
jgi:hypothetical protein